MPTYQHACPSCGASFDRERPMEKAADAEQCPVCGTAAPRVYTVPKFLFKADPRDVRPSWHNHDGYSHVHAPRRGRHRLPSEEH